MTNKYIQKIKEFRLKKGLSQEQVAQAIGVSRPTYTAIEAGKKQNLDLDEAQKLANFFGIGLNELVSGTIENVEKYKQMILAYLRMNLSISRNGRVTKTKLAKLLYFADFAWFYDHLESMSGMQYKKFAYGPVPDTFFRVLDELEEDGKINIERKKEDGKDVFLITESESNKNEKITTISAEERKLMERIAKKWRGKNTQDIVTFTHNQFPYTVCRDNEVIPYELITQEDADKVY
ncbi:MAG: helix-turn-helix domain-containing protein [Candidatus Paceibacterota bacterium]|jgi:transcriptional regulator with XRE-family HTH domain